MVVLCECVFMCMSLCANVLVWMSVCSLKKMDVHGCV